MANENNCAKIEINGKEYILGFFNRNDAKRAEDRGLHISELEKRPLGMIGKIFYTGLLAKQSYMKEDTAFDLMNKYVEEGGDLKEIIGFLSEQYTSFFNFQEQEEEMETAPRKKAIFLKI